MCMQHPLNSGTAPSKEAANTMADEQGEGQDLEDFSDDDDEDDPCLGSIDRQDA